ncbi:MAG: DNA methyltransferase [Candidatus Helarchaeota archaeon]
MKEVKGNYGKCLIIDNMDEINGLPSLEDKSWDLCLTDPPWGYKESNQYRPLGLNRKRIKTDDDVKTYNDEFDESFFLGCVSNILRVSRQSCIATGLKKLNWWFQYYPPLGIFVVVFNNGQCMTKISQFSAFAPYLCYGERFKKHKFHKNIYNTYIRNGFLRDMEGLVHPYPKNAKDWQHIIKELKPQSVIDPFMGSGTAAQVCEQLGIKWLGFEIKKEYIPDIEKRIKIGIRDHKYYRATIQTTLF